jgi:hypothetical protein
VANKLRAIPHPNRGNSEPVLQALTENLRFMTGQGPGKIEKLPDGATTAQIAAKVNEILDRLQGS